MMGQIYTNFRQGLSFIRQGYLLGGVFWFLVRTKTGCFPSCNYSASPSDLVNNGFQVLPAMSDALRVEIIEYFLTRMGSEGRTLNEYLKFARTNGIVRPPGIYIPCSNLLRRIFEETKLDKLASEYLSLNPNKIVFSAAIDALLTIDKGKEIDMGYDGALEFHRDVDSFRFFKVFFYLTDCYEGFGHHEFILGSHKNIPFKLREIRRFSIDELRSILKDRFKLTKVTGPKGFSFAENTTGLHRGTRPIKGDRLILTFTFSDLLGSKFIDLDKRLNNLDKFLSSYDGRNKKI
jgi:hypothetical protein